MSWIQVPIVHENVINKLLSKHSVKFDVFIWEFTYWEITRTWWHGWVNTYALSWNKNVYVFANDLLILLMNIVIFCSCYCCCHQFHLPLLMLLILVLLYKRCQHLLSKDVWKISSVSIFCSVILLFFYYYRQIHISFMTSMFVCVKSSTFAYEFPTFKGMIFSVLLLLFSFFKVAIQHHLYISK